MFADKSIFNEAAYIGEELMKDRYFSDIDRKCYTVIKTVQDGDFYLEEAMDLYGVSQTDIENYVSKRILKELDSFFATCSAKSKTIAILDIISEMYKNYFNPIDKDATEVFMHFEKLSNNIQNDKIRV
ncbi:hypothetical protein [Chitinophaga sp. HK235]|uniref:hypothetical protein n=1 Tax=Chitinophaga sp. HK235 TaxID=2952571 RepID=UPI001BA5ECF6|nr:hypothetical protein [Chitinophaga sp. HK235]